jgi:endonuclease/exonuclease/phosphatase family metal-dependent hydrolase/pimeloyl-ACP methyl ester carboxylesterase
MAVVFGRNIDFQGGGYGTAVLSKLPVKAHSSVKLPSFYDGEQRGVQVVELGSPGEQGLVLLCTHLDYRPDDRERMASAELINNLAANYGDRLMVLAGDLNAEPDSRVMRELEKRWSIASGSAKPQANATTQLFTYPSGTPRKWIDFVLVRPAERWQVVEVRVLEEPVASDHRPLLAVLQPREPSVQSSNSENRGGAVTQRVTSKDGTTIVSDQSGSGPPLVLVGGALSDRSSARRLAELLTPHFTVINYDRRGRGDSGDTAPYTVQREIEDIEALIDQAGGSAFVFGSSSGAVLALEAATKLPAAKVKKLALFEPPFIVDDSRPPVTENLAERVGEFVATGRRGDAVEFFMTKAVGVPAELVGQMRQSPMWPNMEKLAHTLVYDAHVMGDTLSGKPLSANRWSSCRTPTLVLDGGASGAWLRNAARELANKLPNAQQRTLHGQDHSVAVRAPHVLAPVLIEFFAAGASRK